MITAIKNFLYIFLSSKREKRGRNEGREKGRREGVERKKEKKEKRKEIRKGREEENDIWSTIPVLSDSTNTFADYYSIYIICLDSFTSVKIFFPTLICSLKCHCIFSVNSNFSFLNYISSYLHI